MNLFGEKGLLGRGRGETKASTSGRGSREYRSHCVFCNICIGKEPSRTVYQDERVIVFWDRAPAATVHLLVSPITHIKNINRLHGPEDLQLVREMHAVGRRLLHEMQPAADHKFGYHIPPFNSVDHLHLHCFALPHTPPYKAIKYALPQWWMAAEQLEARLEQDIATSGLHAPVPSAESRGAGAKC